MTFDTIEIQYGKKSRISRDERITSGSLSTMMKHYNTWARAKIIAVIIHR